MDRDQFFAELDQLTPKEIEERLSSWDAEQLVLVQEYLDQKGLKQAQTAQKLAENEISAKEEYVTAVCGSCAARPYGGDDGSDLLGRSNVGSDSRSGHRFSRSTRRDDFLVTITRGPAMRQAGPLP